MRRYSAVTHTGFEPVTFSVRGRHPSPLDQWAGASRCLENSGSRIPKASNAISSCSRPDEINTAATPFSVEVAIDGNLTLAWVQRLEAATVDPTRLERATPAVQKRCSTR